ncbi:Glycerophosphodiester transporter GIT2 [Colletotrichum shisoi]|uniref:Glycerophosphodiester transporter GIT2 n=1 Tax=Colletotrichum shisoi TaxID=2078593 RepID=A0A5Q4C1B2_9PEZI|nr:Glycerophosphodiester transporter GIT2 [Colletotrichum shisoi]
MTSTRDVDNAVAPGDEVTGSNDVVLVQDEKKSSGKVGEQVDILEAEPQKAYYSSASVWLMVLFSGLAIGSDGYNAAVIGNVELLLAVLYPDDLTTAIYQRLSNAFLIGMIVGMILFGVVSDQLGRKTGAIATTILLVLGISLSTAANGTTTAGMFWMLIIARGIAGVGAGGEYPVSGAGAAEATDEDAKFRKRRGFMFAMLADLSASLGAASTWFLYNWISIPFGIFSSTIISRANVENSLVKTLGWGVVINCFYIPGPFIGGYLSDKIGRRQTMALGFTLQAILGFVLGGAMDPIQRIFPLFVVLYGIFLTLGEVGPGSTVVLIASESFPTSIRGQMMGLISAASKAGAAIGTQVFTAILNRYTADPSKGNQVAFLIGSGFAVLGAIIALFVIPDTSRHLNDDDDAWKKYLEDNGWDAFWGDEVSQDPSGVVMNKAVS